MRFDDLSSLLELSDPGAALHELIRRLYPLCRSMTGNGVRETLDLLAELIPLERHEVPSGTRVLDWTVPKEWNIEDAYVKNSRGERVIDFRKSNLHVVGYSLPVHQRLSKKELVARLHALPARPDLVPYRNLYYREDWGFCLSQRELDALPDDTYEVCIDSTLADGNLTYGELLVPGELTDEVLLSAHVCHPSLCNDNLSGIAVATLLARYLGALAANGRRPRYSYRFLFAPATIGAITWLARNEARLGRIRHGLVLTLLGDAGSMTYKRSRRGNADIDRAVALALAEAGGPHEIRDFIPYGYDERQYCSPGFDLPVGCLMRTPHAEFPEYHTSGDNLEFVKPRSLQDSVERCLAVLEILENDGTYLNLNPKGEPQLGRRGIFRAFAERQIDGNRELAMLWILNQSDGTKSLVDIALRSGEKFRLLSDTAALLAEHGLLRAVAPGEAESTPARGPA
jgi:aminopeptidase-like protein